MLGVMNSHAIRPIVFASLLTVVAATRAAEVPPTISAATRDANGVLVHEVRSAHQDGTTQLRLLLPDPIDPGMRYPVVYVLPVEARDGHRYGDGLEVIRSLGLHRTHRSIFVGPTVSALPWYSDHPTDPQIRQESYLLDVVIPTVEDLYPARSDRDGRRLIGFSKSGWGAFSLLLRHPDVFGKAAAWDAPLMESTPDRFGMGGIIGDRANFERYQVTRLLNLRAADLRDVARLGLFGFGNFREQHRQAHAMMMELMIPHAYRDGPQRAHSWESGWVAESVDWLMNDPE